MKYWSIKFHYTFLWSLTDTLTMFSSFSHRCFNYFRHLRNCTTRVVTLKICYNQSIMAYQSRIIEAFNKKYRLVLSNKKFFDILDRLDRICFEQRNDGALDCSYNQGNRVAYIVVFLLAQRGYRVTYIMSSKSTRRCLNPYRLSTDLAVVERTVTR